MSYRSLIPSAVQEQLDGGVHGTVEPVSRENGPVVSPLGYSGFVCAGCRAAVTIDVQGDHVPGCECDPGDTADDVRAWSAAENEARHVREQEA